MSIALSGINAAMGRVPVKEVTPGLAIWPLVPPEAGQGWKLELFKISESIPSHYHKVQRQFIIVVDGEVEVFSKARGSNEEVAAMKAGDVVRIDPGVEHSLKPHGEVQFLAFDLPGFEFPDDVFYDAPATDLAWSPSSGSTNPPVDEKYFGPKFDAGTYSVHSLIDGIATAGKWSVALLEIQDSPRHYHKVATEHFIVANGTLDIEIDGVKHVVEEGQSVAISPNQVHHLKSADPTRPVRVLCVNLPAFSPEDMYCC